jgi:hypothetical protein
MSTGPAACDHCIHKSWFSIFGWHIELTGLISRI